MKYVWLNGKFVDKKKASVSLYTHALHYGTAVFEGVRFYETAEGPAIFKAPEHTRRLFYSAKRMGMKIPFTQKEINDAMSGAVKKSGYKSGYIRPIAYLGESKLSLKTKGVSVDVAIIVMPWGKYLEGDAISVHTVKTRRINPEAADPQAKISGVYINSILARMEAEKVGADEALLLSGKGHIAEGSGENFFIVKKGILYTPSLGNILPGITRDTIITLACEHGFKVVEKNLKLTDAYGADEAFFTGTAAEVTPIGNIDGKRIGNGKPGPIADFLNTTYMEVVRGESKKHQKWLTVCR